MPDLNQAVALRDTMVREEFAVSVAPRPPRPKPYVTLSWDTPAGDLTSYRVYAGYSTDHWITNWVVYPNKITNADGTVYTNVVIIKDLEPHPYVFAVAASNSFVSMQFSNSLPAWVQMNSNGYVWGNTFYWLAPGGRTSVVQTTTSLGLPFATATNILPIRDAVLTFIGTNVSRQYFRRLIQ